MWSEIGRILSFEPTRQRGSAVTVLAAVLALLCLVATAFYLGRYAESLAQAADRLSAEPETQEQIFLLWLVTEATDQRVVDLLQEGPAPVALFFWLGLIGTPWLAMLVAADQTSTELGRRHIRFLLPRVRRRTLFLGRAIGGWALWCVFALVGTAAVGPLLTALTPGASTSAGLLLSGRAALTLCLYGLPFVAVMSVFNAMIPNAFLAYLSAAGAWITIALTATLAAFANEAYGYIAYLAPTAVKYPLLAAETGPLVGAVAGTIGYAGVFLLAGGWLLERRDV